jgi:L-methionine (R)-S-oxide reductase
MAAQADSMMERVKEFLRSASGRADGIRRAVEAISGSNPLYHWTGVYLLEAGELVLSHEIGKPTPHRRIPLDKGICGAAAREGKTIVVDDVNADPRYLACTLETRSEIVVPLRAGRRVLGEIDIDSDRRAAFTAEDRSEIEGAAEALSEFLHASAWSVDPAQTQPVRTRSARTEGH